jgi:hypothetical protein
MRELVENRNHVLFRDEAAWAVGTPHYERPSKTEKCLSDDRDSRPLSSLFEHTKMDLINNACSRSSQPPLTIVNRGTAQDNTTTTQFNAATPTGVTQGMLQEPQEDAFANAQALLDNGEGKHVDNETVNFSLSERDCDWTTQRRTELSDKDTCNTMRNTWEEMYKDVDLLPPTLLTMGEAVQGKMRKQHCKENKRLCWEQQLQQPEQSYWSKHQGNIVISHNAEECPEHRNSMCPRGLAMNHPAGALL